MPWPGADAEMQATGAILMRLLVPGAVPTGWAGQGEESLCWVAWNYDTENAALAPDPVNDTIGKADTEAAQDLGFLTGTMQSHTQCETTGPILNSNLLSPNFTHYNRGFLGSISLW